MALYGLNPTPGTAEPDAASRDCLEVAGVCRSGRSTPKSWHGRLWGFSADARNAGPNTGDGRGWAMPMGCTGRYPARAPVYFAGQAFARSSGGSRWTPIVVDVTAT